MKKLMMGFAACALLLSSCAKNEVLTNTSDSNMISFSNLNDRVTKAANTDSDDYGVWAVDANNTTDFMPEFINVRVNGLTNNYGTPVAWPGTTVDFYAYAPHTLVGAGAPTIDGTPATTSIQLAYTVPQVVTDQKDFTVAPPKQATSGSVALEFQHMLSKIKLGTVALSADLLALNYTVEPGTGGYKIKVIAPVTGGKVDLVTFDPLESNWTGLVTATDAARHRYIGSEFYLMPQPSTGANAVLIQLQNVVIKDNTAAAIYTGDILISTIPAGAITNGNSVLTDQGADQFNRGSVYTVNFTLGGSIREPGTDPEDPNDPGNPILPNYINFSSTVVGWADETMGMTL